MAAATALAAATAPAIAQSPEATMAQYRLSVAAGKLEVALGDMAIDFEQKPSWTFRRVRYRGKIWLHDSGWVQPVVFETNLPDDIKDPFLGSGHRPEQVDQVALTITRYGQPDQTAPVTDGLAMTGQAKAITVTKHSRFVSPANGFLYHHQSRITLRPDGLDQWYWFKAADGHLQNLRFMYALMNIWPNSTRHWVVGDDAGAVIAEDTFKDDQSFTLHRPFRWAFIFDPTSLLGTVYVYPRTYDGPNKFWNRAYDNKLYLTVNPPRETGMEAIYEASLTVFAAADGAGWRSQAERVLAQVMTENKTPAKHPEQPGEEVLP